MNAVHICSAAQPEVAEWLAGLGVRIPGGSNRRLTPADVHSAVGTLTSAKIVRQPAVDGRQESITITAGEEFGSLFWNAPSDDGSITPYFERYPLEIMAPILEQLALRCGALVAFAGHEPLVIAPGQPLLPELKKW